MTVEQLYFIKVSITLLVQRKNAQVHKSYFVKKSQHEGILKKMYLKTNILVYVIILLCNNPVALLIRAADKRGY